MFLFVFIPKSIYALRLVQKFNKINYLSYSEQYTSKLPYVHTLSVTFHTKYCDKTKTLYWQRDDIYLILTIISLCQTSRFVIYLSREPRKNLDIYIFLCVDVVLYILVVRLLATNCTDNSV